MEATEHRLAGKSVVAGSNPVTPTSPSRLEANHSPEKTSKVTAPVTLEPSRKLSKSNPVTRRVEQKTRYPGVYSVTLEDGDLSYYVRYRLHGKTKKVLAGRRSDGTTPEQANSKRIELMVKPKLEAIPISEDPTLAELFEIYLRDKRLDQGRPLKSESRLRISFKAHFQELGKKRVSQLQQSDLRALRHGFLSKKLSKKSIYNYLSMFRTVLRHGAEQGYSVLPVLHWQMPRPKELPKTTERLSQQEMERYLAALELESPQVRNLFLCALYTGMRKSELFRLQWKDINWHDRYIMIRDAKSDDANEKVWITEAVEVVLKSQQEIRRSHDHVFFTPKGLIWKERSSAFQKVMNRIRRNSETCKEFRMMHGLRHQYGSTAASMGIPLVKLMELMRHSTVAMTMRYVELMAEEKRDAAEKVSSLINCYKKNT